MLTVLCARPVTSSTPAAGHAGAITTKNVHDKATASDNNSKITKCGWSTRWSPTELGEQVFLRFRDAGTGLPDAWKSGSAAQQETGTPPESAGR